MQHISHLSNRTGHVQITVSDTCSHKIKVGSLISKIFHDNYWKNNLFIDYVKIIQTFLFGSSKSRRSIENINMCHLINVQNENKSSVKAMLLNIV